MNKALVIARRELGSYFFSPLAYVAMTLFLIVCGILFWDDFTPGKAAQMRRIFESMVWILVFILPVLSMGLIAQEWASGTIETLMTAPVGEVDVVLGKFLGSLGFFFVLLAPTLFYVVMLRIYGQPDLGPIISGYLGIILVGALFIAVGLFCSSLTKSQVVAAFMSAAILFVGTIVPDVARRKAALGAFWRSVAEQTVIPKYTDFSRGVIDTGNLVFFVAATAVFLFLTVKVVESRRWR